MTDDLLLQAFHRGGLDRLGKIQRALTCVLQRLLKDNTGAHVVILDIHNEYGAAFGDMVEQINLEKFQPAALDAELPAELRR